jgi:anti-sigma regulatory factor (Ser/Thr protein kinase)
MKNKDDIVHQETLVIVSSQSQLPKVEKLLNRISKRAHLNEEKADNVAIVLTELVNNAIVHGNKNQSEKKVTIAVVYYTDRVEISVKDEGKGFDPARLRDPRDPENIWRENGRGIFLVKNLTDKVEFYPSASGMEIKIIEFYS